MLGQIDEGISILCPWTLVVSSINKVGSLFGYCQTLGIIAIGTLMQNSCFFSVFINLQSDSIWPRVRSLGLVENGPHFCFRHGWFRGLLLLQKRTPFF